MKRQLAELAALVQFVDGELANHLGIAIGTATTARPPARTAAFPFLCYSSVLTLYYTSKSTLTVPCLPMSLLVYLDSYGFSTVHVRVLQCKYSIS